MSTACRQGSVSRDEALELLHRVRVAIGDGVTGAPIARIVADAELSYAEWTVLDRGRLVDPLLDIRLAVSS